jgi:hypothetical protein
MYVRYWREEPEGFTRDYLPEKNRIINFVR